MKGVTIILSLLMLFLSIKPCSDGNDAECETTEVVSTDHDQQQDHDDACPVMCICNCCGISMTYETLANYDLGERLRISSTLTTAYRSNYRFDFHSHIWQPPQWIG